MSIERYRQLEILLYSATRYWRIILLAALLIVGACVAMADAVTMKNMDEFTLTPIDKHTSLLTYYNSAAQNSAWFPPNLEGEGFTVTLQLQITAGDEILTAIPSPGWMAIPEEISVSDGDRGTIKIIEILGF